ncbi:MAG: PmoA family protein [Bryobacterales bacterium]|nr:PmoA family protein [Bryobacterales bacterium]
MATGIQRVSLGLMAVFLPVLLAAQVTVKHSGDKVSITIDGRHESDLYLASPKPYLHPLRAASGKIVSRMYPMAEREGEMKDHQHHRGLFYAHGDVNGVDFWANEASYKRDNLGLIELIQVEETKSGANQGSLRARFAWKSPQGELLLEEDRTMVFHKAPGQRAIDIDLKLTAKREVNFGDTKEGTFALRTAPEFELAGNPKAPKTPQRTGRMVNANGVEGKDIWGKRAPWVDYSAVVDGEKLGIAMMEHPENPRYPTYWHARDYGLFSLNPFGVRDFERNKTLDGSLKLSAGQSVRFRYRILIHSGDEKDANIPAVYERYSRGQSE